MPRLNDIFTALTVAGSLVVLLKGFGQIKISDWLIGIGAGLLVGVTMYYATLFTPYDFLGIVQRNVAQALTRGVCTFIAMLGGLAIMRQSGTVQVSLAQGKFRKMFVNILIGLAIGLPLAILNVFALQFTQGQSIT
jgi:F0F1-type ATP synthase membrane subunit c/vacuolar-type H+-ATPase subunit K